jgi:hypothetical protein
MDKPQPSGQAQLQLTSFWQGIGGGLANQWLAALLTPPFWFWTGGVVAWVLAHRESLADGRPLIVSLANRLTAIPRLPTLVQIAALVGGLVLLIGSGFVVQRSAYYVQRLLQGYWPSWTASVRRQFIERTLRRREVYESRWSMLAPKVDDGSASDVERAEFARLDERLSRMPTRASDYMPTRFGNILKAAESRPSDFYGLENFVCWPRLWLVLPADAKEEVKRARASVDTATQVWLWGILFLLWTVWTPWAAVIGFTVAMLGYQWMLRAAVVYSDLIMSVYDLYHRLLYDALRWPSPKSPRDDREQGIAISQYLWRGSDSDMPFRDDAASNT